MKSYVHMEFILDIIVFKWKNYDFNNIVHTNKNELP